jgi:sua5/yciO/yrdC/ywlC family protein
LANRLYDSLLQFNDIGVDTLLVEGCAPVGLGVAVMNRLEKASGGRVLFV